MRPLIASDTPIVALQDSNRNTFASNSGLTVSSGKTGTQTKKITDLDRYVDRGGPECVGIGNGLQVIFKLAWAAATKALILRYVLCPEVVLSPDKHAELCGA